MNLRFHTDKTGLLDLIHDRWFDLDKMRFDLERCEVTLFLGERSKGPYNDKILKIIGVLSVEVKDEEKIGVYDICGLEIDSSGSTIRIVSPANLEIRLSLKEECSIAVLAFNL